MIHAWFGHNLIYYNEYLYAINGVTTEVWQDSKRPLGLTSIERLPIDKILQKLKETNQINAEEFKWEEVELRMSEDDLPLKVHNFCTAKSIVIPLSGKLLIQGGLKFE